MIDKVIEKKELVLTLALNCLVLTVASTALSLGPGNKGIILFVLCSALFITSFYALLVYAIVTEYKESSLIKERFFRIEANTLITLVLFFPLLYFTSNPLISYYNNELFALGSTVLTVVLLNHFLKKHDDELILFFKRIETVFAFEKKESGVIIEDKAQDVENKDEQKGEKEQSVVTNKRSRVKKQPKRQKKRKKQN